MADNCSEELPTSNVYFKDLSFVEKLCIGLATSLFVVVVVLFIDKLWFILHYYGNYGHHKHIKDKSLFLVGIYPMTAATSLVVLYVPRALLVCEFVSSLYLAVCLYQFTSLIVLYFGGVGPLVDTMQNSGFQLQSPPVCCICCCCPTIQSTRKNLIRLQLIVLQTSFFQPIIAFVSVILWLNNTYESKIAIDSATTYLTALGLVSTLLAMYGLLILFKSTRKHLTTHSVTPKFLVLQAVLLVLNLQRFVFKTLASFGLPACRGVLSSSVQADAIHHMLVILYMSLLAFVARLVYRKPTQLELAGEYKTLHPDKDDLSLWLANDSPDNRVSHTHSANGNVRSYDTLGETIVSSVSRDESDQSLSRSCPN